MISHLRQPRPVRSLARVWKTRLMEGQPRGTHGLERLAQIALAFYLIPALLIVLVVGGLGMIVLGAVRLLTWAVRVPAGGPRGR
jgi:hypothetical protein